MIVNKIKNWYNDIKQNKERKARLIAARSRAMIRDKAEKERLSKLDWFEIRTEKYRSEFVKTATLDTDFTVRCYSEAEYDYVSKVIESKEISMPALRFDKIHIGLEYFIDVYVNGSKSILVDKYDIKARGCDYINSHMWVTTDELKQIYTDIECNFESKKEIDRGNYYKSLDDDYRESYGSAMVEASYQRRNVGAAIALSKYYN